MSRRALGSSLCALTLFACTDKPATVDPGPGPGGSPDGASGGGVDLAGGPGDLALPPHTRMIRLVSSTYDIPAGTENYQCQRVTIPQDMYILRITPVSPDGVHHEVVAIDPSGKPDGKSACGPIESQWQPLFASGVGSPSLDMPQGVALKVSAGSQVVLDLHLFNARPSGTISGEAAVDVVAADTDDGYQIAAVPFIGPVQFTIPSSGASAGIVSGKCTLSNDTTFFAVFPHMHLTGKHIKISAGSTGNETVVWDNDYNFNEQTFGRYPNWLGPPAVSLKRGDHIAVTCTYNAMGFGKHFGDSTTDEMCFAISYVTPAIKTIGGSAFCAL
jgi:hypothetical protein